MCHHKNIFNMCIVDYFFKKESTSSATPTELAKKF